MCSGITPGASQERMEGNISVAPIEFSPVKKISPESFTVDHEEEVSGSSDASSNDVQDVEDNSFVACSKRHKKTRVLSDSEGEDQERNSSKRLDCKAAPQSMSPSGSKQKVSPSQTLFQEDHANRTEEDMQSVVGV